MPKYTPRPDRTRPRCPNCHKKLYWDGNKAKWHCFSGCGKYYTDRYLRSRI